jgi:hypothetical protein
VAVVLTVKLAEGTPPDILQTALEIMNAPKLLVIEPEPHVSATLKPLPVIATKVPTEPELGLSVIVATPAPTVTVKVASAKSEPGIPVAVIRYGPDATLATANVACSIPLETVHVVAVAG